ncbi:hypothetical protein Hdeb2414_s0003g00119561 [Helianthus debilis subsp. tardiflorus]
MQKPILKNQGRNRRKKSPRRFPGVYKHLLGPSSLQTSSRCLPVKTIHMSPSYWTTLQLANHC